MTELTLRRMYGFGENMSSEDLVRRRSCELVNTPLPCVNKAIHHIEKLEVKIKEWFLQNEGIPQKKSIKWASSESGIDGVRDITAESTVLHITGVGLIDKGEDFPLKQYTEDVISEVIQLIWRLEVDHQEAEEALKLEKKRKQGLTTQIDTLSQWKLSTLPEAVQKEYDACAEDLSELQWHVFCKKQELENAQDKAAKTEAVNVKLKKEIDFIRKQRPLLEQKLNHEGDATSRIQQAQSEATRLLNAAEVKLEASRMSFEKVTAEANRERSDMAAKVGEVKRTLQVCRGNLQNAENIWTECTSDLLDTDRKIEDGKMLYSELLNEKQQVTESETSWNQQVTDLKYELDDQEKKYTDLTNIYSRLSQEMEIMEADFQTRLSDLEQQLHEKLHTLRDLEYENKTLTLENEDISTKISNSYRMRSKLEADIQRMQKSLVRKEEQTNDVLKELAKVSVQHTASKAKLIELEEQLSKEETRLKALVDTLRKRIIEEVKSGQVTLARINAMMAERQQKQEENRKIKAELVKKVEEVEQPLAQLEAELIKLTHLYNKKSEELRMVRQQKQQCDKEFSLESQELEHQKKNLQQQLHTTQMQISEVSGQLKNTMEHTEKCQKSTCDLIQYGNIIGNTIKATENAIAKLQQNSNIQELKLNNVKDTSEYLLKEIDMSTQHMNARKRDYDLQMKIRQEAQKQSLGALQAALDENAALVKEYQTLQTSYLDEKDKQLGIFESRLSMEATVRDYLQISVLQSRMHQALVEFFKQQGLYNQAGLARFQAASQENAQKILDVQEEMSKTIQHISAFLTSVTDGSPREDSKENKQSIWHAETKDRESHTVHITV
ncbi:coiled-coil domain-containing protein 178 isoform X2 [Pseudophryne corroboree]|uniref:coiled-coil domain-containing protein 178 isoform X2 n=1 Tax=Pseudophryne corroboree TaxID=495146 RepID=UPI003081AEB1